MKLHIVGGKQGGKKSFPRGAQEKETCSLTYAGYVCLEVKSRMKTDPC